MAIRRILGLDDDNHSPIYVDEYGAVWGQAENVMGLLAQPHQDTYEIKMFAIVDEWSEELSEYDEDMVHHMFDFLSDIAVKPDGIPKDLIFDLFWDSANRIC